MEVTANVAATDPGDDQDLPATVPRAETTKPIRTPRAAITESAKERIDTRGVAEVTDVARGNGIVTEAADATETTVRPGGTEGREIYSTTAELVAEETAMEPPLPLLLPSLLDEAPVLQRSQRSPHPT